MSKWLNEWVYGCCIALLYIWLHKFSHLECSKNQLEDAYFYLGDEKNVLVLFLEFHYFLRAPSG